jgi:GTP-dependent phosphoenolpyruvate carboxykinase
MSTDVTTTIGSMKVSNETLLKWVSDTAAMTNPDRVVWVDGSEDERRILTEKAVAAGILIPLNPQKRPGCYLHRSNPNDVARVEHCTFICTPTKEGAGPTNNWMAPDDAYAKLGKLFEGSMKGRTLYVIPYVMGPVGSPYSKIGVEITDSIYVVLNMRIMTRMGRVALDMLGNGDEFNRGVHSTLDVTPERRFICHFPQDNTLWSVGSDGRLWAINPEAGYFGVAPGTNSKSNPNAMASVRENTIFTNVALTPDGDVWWEGIDGEVPDELTDWQGRPWKKNSNEKAAHPNSRFTAPAHNNPVISKAANDPQGVPISAIIFGGRRATTVPLVLQSFNWTHGVFVGATMGSETTAAATGQVGIVRRDPMAMLPFCGYDMGDYFGHWLEMQNYLSNPPKIFQVNWFRQDANGKFLWPGFGENMRVLKWVIDRAHGRVGAQETLLGWVPKAGHLDLSGLDANTMEKVAAATAINLEEWRQEFEMQGEFFEKLKATMPPALALQRQLLMSRL